MIRKKILFIHHGKGLGGAPLSLLYLIKGLDQSVYEPMVLFLHYSDAYTLYQDEGINVYGPTNTYDFSHTKIWWLRWYSLGMFARVCWDTIKTRWWVAREWYSMLKPDIVHLNTSSLIAWAYVAHQMNIPVVWHIREPLAEGYLGIRKQLIASSVEKYATVIVSICKDNARPWKDNPKTTVVYNAVPKNIFDYSVEVTPFLEKNHLKKESPKVLFLGGLSQEKGTLVILRVFEHVLKQLPDAQLLIAGYCDFTQKSFIKKMFTLYGFKYKVRSVINRMKQSVVLLGLIREVPQAMTASNLVVFPATVGHFARPIIEAGFMKKPVIVSHLKPFDELVLNEQTGFFIDHNDIEQWAEKIVLLLRDEQRRITMGNSNYTFCTRRFGIENHVQKIQKIYGAIEKASCHKIEKQT